MDDDEENHFDFANQKLPPENLVEDLVEPLDIQLKAQKNNNNNIEDIDLSKKLSLDVSLSHDKIRQSTEEQKFAVKLTIKGSEICKNDDQRKKSFEVIEASLDLIVVIDRSGSMVGDKLKEVKKSLKYLVDILKPQDRISLVVFDDGSQIILRPKIIEKSKQLILDAIDNIQVKDKTNIAKGISDAYKIMLNRKTRNQVTGVLLLSDGKDNCLFEDHSAVDGFFDFWESNLKSEEYTLNTFGYGKSHDEKLMDTISKKGSGNFYYIQDIEKVSETFIDCLGSQSSIIGRNARVDISIKENKLFSEVKFLKTYGNSFKDDKENKTKKTIFQNNITTGYHKDQIFEISIKGIENSKEYYSTKDFEEIFHDILEAKLTVSNIENQKFEMSKSLKIEIINELDLEQVITQNDEVIKNLMRVKGAEAMREAMIFANNKNYQSGENLLKEIETQLQYWSNDKILSGLKKSLECQREFINAEKQGVRLGINRQAFSQNLENVYMQQISAPQFVGDCFQNDNMKHKAKKLQSMKVCCPNIHNSDDEYLLIRKNSKS